MSDTKNFYADSKLSELVACLEMATDHLSEIMLRQAIKQMLEREYGAVFDEAKEERNDDPREWIEWGGGAMPMPIGVKVDVRHRSGSVFLNCTAGISGSYAEKWWHSNCPMDYDIIAYRFVK